MAGKASERFVWAVDTLKVRPSDRLLEIGCGHGVAVSLVCETLTTGTITALDRSREMVKMATRRNRAHVDAGTAVLQAVALEDAALGDRRFDKVFARRLGRVRARGCQAQAASDRGAVGGYPHPSTRERRTGSWSSSTWRS